MQVTTQLLAEPAGPTADDIQPVKNETADRIATGTITALPFIALGIVCWQLWNDLLHWSDVAVFGIMYVICAMGVTVGFHRHLTHRGSPETEALRPGPEAGSVDLLRAQRRDATARARLDWPPGRASCVPTSR